MRPIWSITANGTDISERIADVFIGLSLTDQVGMDSDAIEIRVADPARKILAPELGGILTVSLGYAHTGAISMGRWVLDGYDLELAPRVWSLHAHAADLRGSLRSRRTAAYTQTTIGTLVATIAGRHSLRPIVDTSLAGTALERIDQTNESDISFLTRIGQWFDALVTVKQGALIFALRGRGLTATGEPITTINLTPSDVSEGTLSVEVSEMVDAVEARYRDIVNREDKWVRAGSATGIPGQGAEPDNVLRLRGLFARADVAQNACRAKLTALNRNRDSLNLVLPGRADILAETPLQLSGFAAEFDGRWVCSRVTHRLDSGGYRIEIEAERPTERGEVTVGELIPVEE